MTGLGGSANAPVRESGFDIVTASEVMAVLALSSGLEDLRARLSRIVVGFTGEGQPVTAEDIGAVGSMMALLRHAILPNIVQTSEGQPVIVHAGPFGNIAHGCSSVVGDKLALGYADYVLTEAGFRSRPWLREVHAHQGEVQRPRAPRRRARCIRPRHQVTPGGSDSASWRTRTSTLSRRARPSWST